MQRTARDQRDEPERRTWSRDLEPRNGERAVKTRDDTDDEMDDSGPGEDDDLAQMIVIRRHGSRW